MKAAQNFWKSQGAVVLWLMAMVVVILGMVTIGGLTRLTGSGLSITEWDPIQGVIPPLSDADWAEAFAKYRHIPQYLLENRGMSLEGFKSIFWWEWSHRFLARFLGTLYFAGFVWFAWTGAIKRADWPRMTILFALFLLQAFVGWWMVESGLETRVTVSQYRLAIHLGAALLLLIAILWTALDYLGRRERARPAGRGVALVTLVYFQMLLGALVAGLHAGLVYNTWPDMNGRVFPENPFFTSPWWLNFFENDGLAQFDHRIGAYIVAGFAAYIYFKGVALTGMARRSAKLVGAVTAIQIGLGIVTLLLMAPEGLAAAHQLTAALLLCAAVWHAHELRYRA